MKNFLRDRFLQGLDVLKDEITEVGREGGLWTTRGKIVNPPATLALHLAGNIQHFIGAQLGHNGYVRHRDREFSEKNLSVEDLQKEIKAARLAVTQTFLSLLDASLAARYPVSFLGKDDLTVQEVLFILHGHLYYHLGQINYCRRMLSDT